MWSAIAKLLSGAMEAWNAYQAKQRQAHDENNGRNLQAIDAMSKTVKESQDARKRDAEVDSLDRAGLERDLGLRP